MASSPKHTLASALGRLFRSDSLGGMVETLSRHPELRRFIDGQLVRLYAIVDANVINGELRWRLGKRQNPEARTALEEVLDSGIVVMVAPSFLKEEIQEHLAEIAAECGTTIEAAQREWQQFRSKLRYYNAGRGERLSASIDGDDLPYQRASKELGLPIYTRDADLINMGAPVIWAELDLVLRDHVRSRSIAVGVTYGSTYSLTIAVGALRGAVELVKKAFRGFRNLPPGVQVLIVGALVALIAHPKSRKKIAEFGSTLCDLKSPLIDGLLKLADEIATANNRAEETKRDIEKALPVRQKTTAIIHARRACVLCASPLSVEELIRQMRKQGYVSKSKTFKTYLTHQLRNSGQFVKMSDGRWSLASAAEAGA